MRLLLDIPQGCFSENWTPLPSKLKIYPLSPPLFWWCFSSTSNDRRDFKLFTWHLWINNLEFISDNRAPIPSNWKSPLSPLNFLTIVITNFQSLYDIQILYVSSVETSYKVTGIKLNPIPSNLFLIFTTPFPPSCLVSFHPKHSLLWHRQPVFEFF